MAMDVTMPDGTVIRGIPDGTSKDAIYAKWQGMQNNGRDWQPDLTNTAIDAVRAIPGGLYKGVTGLLTAPQGVASLINHGLEATVPGYKAPAPLPSPIQAGSDAIVRNTTGGYYTPKTTTGQVAETAASFAPNLIGGEENLVPRLLTRAILPATGATLGGKAIPASVSPLGHDAAVVAGTVLGGLSPAALARGASLAGDAVSGAVGLRTGSGGAAVSGLHQAGFEGGTADATAAANLRNQVPQQAVVDQLRGALSNMRVAKSQAYQDGMLGIHNDPTVLDFAPIDKALADASNIKQFKGIDISKSTAAVRSDVNAAIDQWRQLDPTEYHTPAGFDALKQQIGDLRDGETYGSPAWKYANDVYGSIRNTIAKQAPAYDKVMKDYADASDEIDNIQRELSLGRKSNPGTALRKVQAIMRDNANTAWGARAANVDTLSANGADNVIPALAGQAMNSWLPRGLLARGASLLELGGHAATLGTTLPTLFASSPRLMGELALASGRVRRGLFGASRSANVPVTYSSGFTNPRTALTGGFFGMPLPVTP